MKRTNKTVYATDADRPLITITGESANVEVFSVTVDELEQLASACSAAAEELRSMTESAYLTSINSLPPTDATFPQGRK